MEKLKQRMAIYKENLIFTLPFSTVSFKEWSKLSFSSVQSGRSVIGPTQPQNTTHLHQILLQSRRKLWLPHWVWPATNFHQVTEHKPQTKCPNWGSELENLTTALKKGILPLEMPGIVFMHCVTITILFFTYSLFSYTFFPLSFLFLLFITLPLLFHKVCYMYF